VVEPVINDKDWPWTLENMRDYLASIVGGKGVPLAYVTRNDSVVPDVGVILKRDI
jgi:hypothetical protein